MSDKSLNNMDMDERCGGRIEVFGLLRRIEQCTSEANQADGSVDLECPVSCAVSCCWRLFMGQSEQDAGTGKWADF